ncbi:hypothetical protein Q5P01_024278 [Channa striata]|uniref:Secreted protein n=1 Tax=Channa striata TaxID=64152 RepID=A0AA88IQN9_CHASR|nr:hypothetical protein Q5P01_024278 [Channa striata]
MTLISIKFLQLTIFLSLPLVQLQSLWRTASSYAACNCWSNLWFSSSFWGSFWKSLCLTVNFPLIEMD